MSGRRRELFPPDRGLQLRMALAVAVNAVLVVGLVGFLVWLVFAVEDGWAFVFFVLCFAVIGAGAQQKSRGRRHREAAAADTAAARERVGRAVQPLCLLAELEVPEIEIVPSPVALTWTTAMPWRTPKLHVTTELLERTSDEQLAAALAHELSHIANGDAVVMTVLAGPPSWILLGIREMWSERREDWRNALAAVLYGSYSAVLALPAMLVSRVVSRHRELAADRGAAVLTGSPAGVADALLTVSGEIARRSDRDLRAVAAANPFYLLPARRREPRWLGRITATHPRLKKRLAQLERMEEELQTARAAPPGPH